MRLGNVGGKNKGKKYLKITGKEVVTPENQFKANYFKEWFSKNYSRIQVELIGKGIFNEDLLNDTFLRIYDKIRFGGLSIVDYKAYFHRAYFTNFVQHSMKKSEIERMFVPDEYAVDAIDETADTTEVESTKRKLCKDVLDFVKMKFDTPTYNLFLSYIKTGSRHYDEVSVKTNIPRETIAEILSRVKRIIKSNREFVRIRKSM